MAEALLRRSESKAGTVAAINQWPRPTDRRRRLTLMARLRCNPAGPGSSPSSPENRLFPFQPAHDLVELVVVAVLDVHGTRALAGAMIDGDGEAERVRNALLQRAGVGVFALRLARLCL